MSAAWALLRRDLILALRQGGGASLSLAFFVIAGTLAGLGLGPSPDLLARAGPGMIWVLALLSCLLSLDRLFQADFEDGHLDLILMAPSPLSLLVLAKIAAHWLTTGLSLTLTAPALALLFNLEVETTMRLVFSLALGTPALSLIGGIGAALTLQLKRGGLLLSLLVLPLYVPVLIFGVASVELGGASFGMVAGLSLIALVLAPLAIGAALRLQAS